MRALSDASTYTHALTTFAVETARATDTYCRFMTVSADGEWLQSAATAMPPHRPLREAELRILDQPIRIDGDSLAAKVVREQRTLHIPEVTEAHVRARFPDPATQEQLLKLATKSAVLVPVVGRDGLLGVLSLVRTGEDALAFDADDVWFAEQLAAHAALALTDARLVTAVQERASRLQLVSDLTREVAEASGNFEQLLEVIVRRLGAALADFCVIRLVRRDGLGFELGGAVYNRDPELEEMHRALLRAHATHPLLAGDVLDTRATVRVPHVDLPALLATLPPSFVTLLGRIDPSTYMAVPLRLHGAPLAVLLLGRAKGGAPFTADEQQIVEDLAIHATIAMTNARLIETAARTAERLRVLMLVAAELDAGVDEPQNILEKVARKLSELVGGACIVLVAPDGETIESSKAVSHPDPAVVARIRAVLGTASRRAEGVTRRVLAGEAVLISGSPDEVAAPVSPYVRDTVAALGIRSLLALPLRVGTQVLGTATLLRAEGAPYTADDLQFAQDLLTHAALAIRNSRLLGSVQHELAERQRTERALRQSEEQFRHAQKMEAVGRLAGGVAHDFNNLLTVVLHACGFITDALPANSPILEDVEQIRQAGERAAKLTRQLLTFSRQEVLQPEILDLGTHIANLRSLLERLLGERYKLSLRTAPELGKVKADGTHIEQIVMNLAINARDAMPSGGTLTVETSNVVLDELYVEQHMGVSPGAYVMIAVSDTGEGMTKETQQRIFEPFFTTKPVGKGTGLGLSTVFGIVEQNGGTIWTYSELGKGTTFKIYLPRTDAEIRVGLAVPARSVARGEMILLVEDEDIVRRTVVRVLGRKGYRVIEARNGREALDTYVRRAAEIELVLTDVMMPVMGGAELAKQLLLKQPGLPILFMSGYIDDSILEAGTIEPETLISKPLNLEVLMQKIRAGLDGRHS